jgi:hypothetical protein
MRSNAAKELTACGKIVIIIFAGWVTSPRSAVAVNAVSASNLVLFALARRANITKVRIGENIPRAFAVID